MVSAAALVAILAQSPAAPAPDRTASENALAWLKSAAGAWEGTLEWSGARSGKGALKANYSVAAAGSAVVEELVMNGVSSMTSVYHVDGADLRMTHYCAAGNQPRMRAQGWKGNTLSFRFVDVANLKSPSDGYMSSLNIKLEDADHVTAEWTYRDNGKETTYAFHLQRVK
jgi:hypothetical protein